MIGAIALTSLGSPNRWLHWYPAALVGLSPLLYLCWHSRSIRQQVGYCTSICLGFSTLVFLPDPLSVPALTGAETIAGALVSPLVPLYFVVTALLSLQVSHPCPTWLRPIAIATAWTGFDGLFAILQFPLPLHYGACLFDFTQAIQIADVTGIWGVTFIAIFSNATLAAILASARQRLDWKPMLVAMVLWAIVLLYGAHQEAAYNTARLAANLKSFSVGTVQQVAWLTGDRSQDYRHARYREVQALSKTALVEGAHLLVWPEGAMRIQVAGSLDETLFIQPLLDLLPQGGGLIVGSSELAPSTTTVSWDERKFINTALLYSSNGNIRDRYGKQWLFKYFETARFVPSEAGYSPLDAGNLLGPIGTQICLESVMPRASRELVRAGAESLIAISDDSWFGRSNWPILHGVLSVFRAVENRRSFVFVNNTGGNLVITPAGEIAIAGKLWQQLHLNGPVYRMTNQTFANRYGDWLVWLCLIGSIGLWGWRWQPLK